MRHGQEYRDCSRGVSNILMTTPQVDRVLYGLLSTNKDECHVSVRGLEELSFDAGRR